MAGRAPGYLVETKLKISLEMDLIQRLENKDGNEIQEIIVRFDGHGTLHFGYCSKPQLKEFIWQVALY